ncbi:MAG: type II toxin-antitoxin system RelE/ParE family toxin [Armatimonadota bacterium]|nr:type II toxin-antitoxin system RelE/ParE family toxin [Armatimonadota bacterium]
MPEEYRVQIMPSARRELESLHDPMLKRALSALTTLASDPRPRGSKKLVGRGSNYRLRVGDYRIVYDINDADKLVVVYRIRHRREVY